MQEDYLLGREMQVIKRFFLIGAIALPACDNFESILVADCLLNKNRSLSLELQHSEPVSDFVVVVYYGLRARRLPVSD